MTRLAIGGAVLVLAIVFGFVFWNQFKTNQEQLAGGNPYTQNNNNTASDNLNAIEADLSSSQIDSIDSDSSQLDAQLSGF